MFKILSRLAQPNDRWNLIIYANEWIKFSRKYQIKNSKKKIILIFCSYRGEFIYNIVLGSILSFYGNKIKIIYLPKLRSPIKEPLSDTKDTELYLHKVFIKLMKKHKNFIEFINLRNFKSKLNSEDIKHLKNRAELDTKMCLRIENLNLKNKNERKYYLFYLKEGLKTLTNYKGFLESLDLKPDLILIPNGSTFDTSHIVYFTRKSNLQFNCWDKFSFRFTRMINHNGHVREFTDIDHIWKMFQEKKFLKSRQYSDSCSIALENLNLRKSGSTDRWVTKTQLDNFDKNSKAKKYRNFQRKTILICSNVPFDAGYDKIITIFPSMGEWLVKTVEYLLSKHKNIDLIIRAHPDEQRYNAKTTTQTLIDKIKLNKSNVNVYSGLGVNTYDLIDKMHLGIVFSSTVGLEMSMLGKKVLLGSEVYYSKKGFTIDPKNSNEYFNLLDLHINSKESVISKIKAYKAQFYHYLLHSTLMPYPFDKPSGIQKINAQDFFKNGILNNFKETFDSLSMNDQEWKINIKSNINNKVIL